ncbi:MAG: GyrI-like domain-containing protein [Roseburia sp.]|nr:GyrI-like domain-containing protein [Roseburia sp.]
MAFDYKKEYKEFYLPKKKPEIVEIPTMKFLAVRGKGDPNEEGGAYKEAIGLLYGIAFTIKMSYKGDHRIEGYFDYVVPPLEGFWWQGARHTADALARTDRTDRREDVCGIDYAHKETFEWISVIRVPEFVTKADFEWAVAEATQKKKTDFSKVEFLSITEGLCVQCMHIGPYDDEPATIRQMDEYVKAQGYELDFTDGRRHHEIYLSDVRRCAPEKLKTVIRHPVKAAGE